MSSEYPEPNEHESHYHKAFVWLSVAVIISGFGILTNAGIIAGLAALPAAGKGAIEMRRIKW